jgi:hypothetical protein
MLECPGSLRLNTCPKTDTCRRASTELAKRPAQAPGRFPLADLVRDQKCSDNLLSRSGDRSHRVCIVAPIDSNLRDLRHRMRASPEDPACHILVCLYRPNKDRETRRRCRLLRPLGRCCVDRCGNEQWRLLRHLSARDNGRRHGCCFALERDA